MTHYLQSILYDTLIIIGISFTAAGLYVLILLAKDLFNSRNH